MFKLLETYKIVYETRNFSKASEKLFISQPAVSNQIKQLEADLQVTLFIRNGRQEVMATPQADTLYKDTLNLLEDWQEIKYKMHHKDTKKIRCKLAASHTFAIYVLPQLLIDLEQKFPQVQFSVQMLNSYEVFTAIQSHEIEFGFIEKPLATGSVKRTALMQDELVYVGQKDQPWLLREGTSGVYHYTKRFMEENNIDSKIIEIQNNELIVEMLKLGFGQTILSKRAAKDLPYQTLSEEYLHHFYLVEREHLAQPIILEMISFIKQWSKSHP